MAVRLIKEKVYLKRGVLETVHSILRIFGKIDTGSGVSEARTSHYGVVCRRRCKIENGN